MSKAGGSGRNAGRSRSPGKSSDEEVLERRKPAKKKPAVDIEAVEVSAEWFPCNFLDHSFCAELHDDTCRRHSFPLPPSALGGQHTPERGAGLPGLAFSPLFSLTRGAWQGGLARAVRPMQRENVAEEMADGKKQLVSSRRKKKKSIELGKNSGQDGIAKDAGKRMEKAAKYVVKPKKIQNAARPSNTVKRAKDKKRDVSDLPLVASQEPVPEAPRKADALLLDAGYQPDVVSRKNVWALSEKECDRPQSVRFPGTVYGVMAIRIGTFKKGSFVTVPGGSNSIEARVVAIVLDRENMVHGPQVLLYIPGRKLQFKRHGVIQSIIEKDQIPADEQALFQQHCDEFVASGVCQEARREAGTLRSGKKTRERSESTSEMDNKLEGMSKRFRVETFYPFRKRRNIRFAL